MPAEWGASLGTRDPEWPVFQDGYGFVVGVSWLGLRNLISLTISSNIWATKQLIEYSTSQHSKPLSISF